MLVMIIFLRDICEHYIREFFHRNDLGTLARQAVGSIHAYGEKRLGCKERKGRELLDTVEGGRLLGLQ
jgi:hypothetical protein